MIYWAELWIGRDYWKTVSMNAGDTAVFVDILEPISAYMGDEYDDMKAVDMHRLVFDIHERVDTRTWRAYLSVKKTFGGKR